jgi:SanA protein
MKRKVFKVVIGLILTLALTILLSNYTISSYAEGKTFDQVSEIPENRVGIVLGTSKKLVGGNFNLFYRFRIEATVKLFKAKKIKFVLVSGDNSTKYYNEPETIKQDLIEAGIPSEKLFLDYAGFRTLDSMVRAKEVFGLDEVTVISQKFHTERAIYLSEKKGLKAIGFNAKNVSGNSGLKVLLRESLARVKVFVDLLFNTQPKFLGKQIVIE